MKRLLILGLVGALAPAVMTGTASADGTYPGETLSLAQSGSSVAGTATAFLASGQQTDVGDYAGGFDLNVFAKDPSVDSTCAPSYWEESNNSITDPSEQRVVIGDWEGMDTTFSVPFKLVFDQPGQVLLCAYSDWITDTAASAQLLVNVAPAASPGSPVTTPPPSGPSATPSAPSSPSAGSKVSGKPRNTSRPKVKRTGRLLSCTRGSWSNAPNGFTYRWLVNGHRLTRSSKPRLAVANALHGHRVQCSVRAANGAGAATAVSRSLTIR